jgi:hypothetical protein
MVEVPDDSDLNHSIKMLTFRPEAHPGFLMPPVIAVLFYSCTEGK